MSSETRRAYLALGVPNPGAEEIWRQEGGYQHYLSFTRANPTGRRLGKLALGLGVDSVIVVIWALFVTPSGTRFLCASPWIAVALRIFGVRKFEVTGIYATPGSRAWRVLRWAIGSNPVVTMLETEAAEWNSQGGQAKSIAYGNTFGYPPKIDRKSATFRIFVGGTSDRDAATLSRLIREVQDSETAVELIVADGSGPHEWRGLLSTIRRLPIISYADFGRELAKSDIVFLPLQNKQRSAGHMVAVGALESGVRVATTPVEGMKGYIDGRFVVAIDELLPQLPQLRVIAAGLDNRSGADVRAHWHRNFSLRSYARRVCDALESMRVPADGD